MKLCSDVFWLRPGQLTSAQASVVVTGGEDGGSVRVARALLVADSGLLRAVLEEGEVESRVHVAGVAGAKLELYAEMLQHGDSMSIVSREELWALLTLLEILRSSHRGSITLVVDKDKSNNGKTQNYTCLKRKITNTLEALSPRKKNKISQAGPSHNPNFVMEVNFNELQCTGCGGSKKIAKQAAARSAQTLQSIDLQNRNDCDNNNAMNNDEDGESVISVASDDDDNANDVSVNSENTLQDYKNYEFQEDDLDDHKYKKDLMKQRIEKVFNKLQTNRSLYIAGENCEEFLKLLNEAQTLMDLHLNTTSDLVQDSRQIKYLCNLVREMAENL